MKNQNSNLKTQIDISKSKSSDVKVRAYNLSLATIKFVNSLPNQRAFWSIGDQLLRSITSIGANIIEAKSSSSRREFIKFYEIALKSGNESKYWLSLLHDSYPELAEQCKLLLDEATQVCNMIASSVLTLKGKNRF